MLGIGAGLLLFAPRIKAWVALLKLKFREKRKARLEEKKKETDNDNHDATLK